MSNTPSGGIFGTFFPYKKDFIRRWLHYLFSCPFRLKTAFHCKLCGKPKRCYWDGNDIEGLGINICHKCSEVVEAVNRLDAPPDTEGEA